MAIFRHIFQEFMCLPPRVELPSRDGLRTANAFQSCLPRFFLANKNVSTKSVVLFTLPETNSKSPG